MAFPKAYLLATVLAASTLVQGWTWPSPALDKIESLRYDQRGAHAVLLAELGNPCGGDNIPGRPNAADWLRAAFHDVGTRNASSGLGGLDASIRFPTEFNRPENAGDFIVDTIKFLRPFASRLVPLSDLVALGAVFALEQCGGPHVNFRAGRVDAKNPSPPGLPGPPDALKTLTAKFSRAGFTQQEMREMVACGHVIGGVDPHTFPDVFPGKTFKGDVVVPFDRSEDVFDNKMMKEYVAGRSVNPLVISKNVTDRSDLRIFSSDGNVTIKAMADSLDVFNTKCSSIITRMIDAVPAGVKLTEVITPTLVKPDGIKLLRNSDNSFNLFGRVRFWGLDAAGTANRTVKILWAGADGKECAGCSHTLTTTSVGISHAPSHSALWYDFPKAGISISATTSISKFWFEVTEDGHTAIHDQHGPGFPLQTNVVLSADSCISKTGNTATAKITVPKSSTPSRVFVEADDRAANGDVSKITHTATLDKTLSAKSTHFNTYTVSLAGTKKVGDGTFNVAATIAGKEVSDWSFFDSSDAHILSTVC